MKHLDFLIKPVSRACNMRCSYCFYEDITKHRHTKAPARMSEDLVTKLLSEAFSLLDGSGGSVHFAFQGGEPTLAGLSFYQNFVFKAQALCPRGTTLSYSMQTNGLILNELWARFFFEHHVLVGISIDGFEQLHDRYRKDAHQEATYAQVRTAFCLLKEHQVDVNALCVVTKECAHNARKVYRELKRMGADFIQFIPCLDPIEVPRGSMPYSLLPEDYGTFLCEVFDLWYGDLKRDHYHSIRLFDDYVHLSMEHMLTGSDSACGSCAGTCATTGNCGGYSVVESDGTLYPCDFYTTDEWALGNLSEQSLSSLLTCRTQKAFLSSGKQKPAECKDCRWRHLCNGGCKNDWISGPHNYYCKSLKTFFAYVENRLTELAQMELRLARPF